MINKTEIKHICCDLDGVIVDSLEIMKKSWDEVNNQFNLNIGFSKYQAFIGKEFFSILAELKIKNFLWEEIKQTYDQVSSRNINNIKVYEEFFIFLQQCNQQNIGLSIFTSKTKKRTEEIIKNQLNKIDFNLVITPEDLKGYKPKPSGDGIKLILKKLKIPKSDFIYIGDTFEDFKAASDANVKFYFATWGFGENHNFYSNKLKLKELDKLIFN